MKLLLCVTTLAILSGQASSAVTHSSQKTRTIAFSEKGVGKYYIDDGKTQFMAQWPEFAERKLAKGRVTVPFDADVAVETYWCTGDCLPELRLLKASDIQSLDVDGSILTHRSFRILCKLAGLKKLILEGTDADDQDIDVIARNLPGLKELRLGYTRLSDRSLSSIAKMPALKALSLEKNRITSTGVARLAGMQNLCELNLKETNIDDRALCAFVKYKKLSALNLSRTRITDKGILKLSALQALRKLDLSKTQITDAAVCTAISKLENLEELNLSGTHVTDRGVAALSRLKHLRKLWLRDLPLVTDASTPSLIAHNEMQDLELQKTNISAAAINRIANALPKSEVHSHPLCKCRKQSRVN